MLTDISVVMIAKDAQETIGATLDSLLEFSDVVVYLNNSVDSTKEIAQSYSNVNIVEGEFLGFGPTKTRAADFAKNDWILSLDSDEVLPKDFVDTLSRMKLDESCVYAIDRVNFYKTTKIKHCWANDIIVRLYSKKLTSFDDANVHEKVMSDGFEVVVIKDEVFHYPYQSISDFIVKLDRYSSIFANEHVGKKNSSPSKAFFNGSFSFFKTYFLKKGFLDGYAGLVIAFSHMATNFYKYIKLYELNKEQKK